MEGEGAIKEAIGGGAEVTGQMPREGTAGGKGVEDIKHYALYHQFGCNAALSPWPKCGCSRTGFSLAICIISTSH